MLKPRHIEQYDISRLSHGAERVIFIECYLGPISTRGTVMPPRHHSYMIQDRVHRQALTFKAGMGYDR